MTRPHSNYVTRSFQFWDGLTVRGYICHQVIPTAASTRRTASALGSKSPARLQATRWEARQWEAWHFSPQYHTLWHREQDLRARAGGGCPAWPQPEHVRWARVRMQARVRGEGIGMPNAPAKPTSGQRLYRRVANSAEGQCTSRSAWHGGQQQQEGEGGRGQAVGSRQGGSSRREGGGRRAGGGQPAASGR